MQPQHAPAKPVMDIAAPPRPVPPATSAPAPSVQPVPVSKPAAPLAPSPQIPNVMQHMDVAKAPDDYVPLSPAAPQTTPLSAASEPDKPSLSSQPATTRAKSTKAPQPLPQGPHLPAALITVTILVMLVLSGIAVMVYMTAV